MSNLRFAGAIALVVVLSACASSSSGLVDTLKYAGDRWAGDGRAKPPELRGGFRYLKVVANGEVSYLALGYLDPPPVQSGPSSVEVWYSASGQSLRLKDGRLAGTAGLPTDWLDVRMERAPDWSAVGREGVEFERERDVMPGYRYRIRDQLRVRPVLPPETTDLIGVDKASLLWYEETVESSTGGGLPPAYFGVIPGFGSARVVYSFQCVAADLCLSTQSWPPDSIAGAK